MTMDSGFDGPPPVEQEMAAIDQALTTLKGFEKDRIDPRVEAARNFLRDFLTPHKPWMEDNNLIATIHGSMQYNDPVNLDSDLVFVGEDHTRETFEEMHKGIELPLRTQWPTGNRNVEVSFSTIQEMQDDIDEGKDPHDDDTYGPLTASYILSGMPVFPEDEPKLAVLRSQAKEILKTNPEFRKATMDILTDTIAIRQERRQEKPYLDNQ